jgi:hypothetical protein
MKPSHIKGAETKEERRAKFLEPQAKSKAEKSDVPLKDKTRTTVNIKPSYLFLKNALQKLNKDISNSIDQKRRPYIQACLKGTSYIHNAKVHEGNNYVLLTDISGFFTKVKREKVKSQLKKYLNIDGDTADYYARMATCPEDEGSSEYVLGQGLPSSPILALVTNIDLFDHIYDLCQTHGYLMTVYVDDLVISSPIEIPQPFINDIFRLYKANGIPLKRNKTHYKKPNQNKRITGLIVGRNGTTVPNRQKERLFYINQRLASAHSWVTDMDRYFEAYYLYLVFVGVLQQLSDVEMSHVPGKKDIWPQQYVGFYNTKVTLASYFPLGIKPKRKGYGYSAENVSAKDLNRLHQCFLSLRS